ncbi:MAG TPA: hypothetical protein VHC22_05025 [Pirellulales bacterium]|nr:hypothetical protein [Pirellulales bacterium]
MFAIHQRTRRRICQAGFCLLCAMPTTGLLAWTASMKTGSHLARCRQELGERLGLTVRCERIRYPQPGQSVYERFELADAETGEWVLRCRSLEVTRTGRTLALAPGDVEVAAPRANKLLRLVQRRLAHELPGDDAVWLTPTQVTLVTPSASQTYEDVDCRIDTQGDASTATLHFRLPDPQPGEPPMVAITRNRSPAGISTTIKLDTLGTELPVSVFSPWLDLQRELGRDAAFSGSFTVVEGTDRTDCQIEGLFSDLDLHRLVTRRFPHHLTGIANVELKADISEGGVVEAVGLLRCESGAIGDSLLAAAIDLLDCQPGTALQGRRLTAGTHQVFHDLAFDFTVNREGVRLESWADAQPAGALLLDVRGASLLGAPSGEPLPLVQLVRALVPESELLVPATKETARLVPWLPLPPAVPAPGAKPQAPPLTFEE